MRVQLKRPRHTQPHDRLHRIRCLLRRSRPRTLRSDGSCPPLAVTAPVAAVHRSNSEWQHAASQAVQKKPYLGLRSYSTRLPELATCLFGEHWGSAAESGKRLPMVPLDDLRYEQKQTPCTRTAGDTNAYGRPCPRRLLAQCPLVRVGPPHPFSAALCLVAGPGCKRLRCSILRRSINPCVS